MRAGIALGSNLGDRLASLRAARERVREFSEPPIVASPVYETEPVGCERDAPRFFNAVLEIGFSGEAIDLLSRLRETEAAMGRPLRHMQNASRTIDLDLLYFGDLTSSTPELELPHPRMRERRFVLAPLADIRPELILPGETETVATLLGRLPEGSPLVRVASEW